MKLNSLLVIPFLVAPTLAADCFGLHQTNLGRDFGKAYWDARNKMCSNSDCEYQKDCVTTSSKTVYDRVKVTDNVYLKRQKLGGTGGFKDCWDATEDIINQCVYGSGQTGGTWAANGQFYELISGLS